MLFKDRYKVWAILMAVCILAQLVFHVVGPLAINGIQSLVESYEQRQEELEQEQATAPSKPTTEENESTETISAVMNILCRTAQYVGIIILVFGVFNVMLAFMHEDAERTSHGVQYMVIGAAMVGLSIIAPTLLSDTKSKQTEETEIATTHQTDDILID